MPAELADGIGLAQWCSQGDHADDVRKRLMAIDVAIRCHSSLRHEMLRLGFHSQVRHSDGYYHDLILAAGP